MSATNSAIPIRSGQRRRESQNMEAIGRLVSGVAHDFNNLLTGIVLCSDLILAGLEKDSRLRRYAQEIRSAGQQGAELIQQLLAVARERGVEPRRLQFNDIIRETDDLLVRLIGENIELVTELAGDLDYITMDPTQARQLVLNLVLNARDAMPEGGQVRLTTRNRREPERRQDIPLLAGYFLDRLSRDCGRERLLSDAALKAMLAYDWPGNVRELENCLERACALNSGPEIQVTDLPGPLSGNGHIIADKTVSARIVPMSELEKQTILTTIMQLNGDKLLAARLLGIGKTTLYRKLKEYASQDS